MIVITPVLPVLLLFLVLRSFAFVVRNPASEVVAAPLARLRGGRCRGRSYTLANHSTGRTADACTHNGPGLAGDRLANRRPGRAAYCATHDSAGLSGSLGRHCRTGRPPDGTTNDGAGSAADRLADRSPGGGTNGTANGGLCVVCRAAARDQRNNDGKQQVPQRRVMGLRHFSAPRMSIQKGGFFQYRPD
jgi:hypothetical protein